MYSWLSEVSKAGYSRKNSLINPGCYDQKLNFIVQAEFMPTLKPPKHDNIDNDQEVLVLTHDELIKFVTLLDDSQIQQSRKQEFLTLVIWIN